MQSFLEKIYDYYNNISFCSTDPILFPHKLNGNKEYVAFLSSLFAYGRVKSINQFLNNLFNEYGTEPSNITIKKNLYYRFQTNDDIFNFLKFLKNIYDEFGSLYNYFLILDSSDVEKAYYLFRKDFLETFKNNTSHGLQFLLPDIYKSSAKRIRMFFRWMIRKDSIDFGIWKKYDKKLLKAPLDIHILTYAYNMNIIKNKSNNFKNVLNVTNYFLKVNNYDPLKYDFAITRLGMLEGCKFRKKESCKKCRWFNGCVFN
ncbi:TIGR02757 family protein [Deferribacter thermophilus]|uniref:TIGR02757 family protein n=1 Tax=Deferribacter thermophilus TaxID=53573 RepID=UPI003C220B91